ncbi:PAS domain S-box-containing protein [Paraburkholderia sp. BL23I1N1]|uniref:PAS domain-containing sensor histidine kinase n=1 Tax=Paraburkholderia sp. BL23I1N1 TaxID=1938802 RepID=UPI000FF1CD6F|nr:PAS domain-containing sensor histidine kinase [Paraburkholderia sp. BL23I1N1]RKE37939.1 PAS domain S-box-containing protein [Paraburkholderia sp. BL23I1N1]
MDFEWNDAKRKAGAANDSDVPLEDRYQLLIDAVQDYAIFMLDPAGRVASWNSGARKIKGYSADEIIGRHFSLFYTPEDVAADKPGRELALATARGRAEDQGWRVRRNGSRFWADVTITAVYDPSGALLGFAKVTRDMTERVRLAELEHAIELSAQIQSTREDEQKRIARELHDDLGQQLTALKMGIAALEGQLTASNESPAALAATGDLQRQIDTMMASLRRIASNLRPPMLDDLGLTAALEWLADDFTHRYDAKTTVQVHVDDATLTESASTAIFRIVQEALTNVAKHAHANEVRIAISASTDTCTVRIEDDGRGAEIDGERKPRSFGLLGMRERARQLGGFVLIDSAPGAGFRIAAHIPLSAIQSDQARTR